MNGKKKYINLDVIAQKENLKEPIFMYCIGEIADEDGCDLTPCICSKKYQKIIELKTGIEIKNLVFNEFLFAEIKYDSGRKGFHFESVHGEHSFIKNSELIKTYGAAILADAK